MAKANCIIQGYGGEFLQSAAGLLNEPPKGPSVLWTSEYPDAPLYTRAEARRVAKVLRAHGYNVVVVEDYALTGERKVEV